MKLAITTTTPRLSGYRFEGWRLDNNPRNPLLQANAREVQSTTSATGNTTLTYFAQWICLHESYIDEGFCRSCEHDFTETMRVPPGLISMNPTIYYAINDGTHIRTRPYDRGSSIIINQGASVTVVGRANNWLDRTWYLLDTGEWVYSGRVELQNPICSHTSYDNLGYCTSCRHDYMEVMLANATENFGMYYPTRRGVYIHNRPYSSASSPYVLNVNDLLFSELTAYNSQNELWYRVEYPSRSANWSYRGNSGWVHNNDIRLWTPMDTYRTLEVFISSSEYILEGVRGDMGARTRIVGVTHEMCNWNNAPSFW